MKKVILSILILVFGLSLFTSFTACTPDKMEKIVGTYKLVTDTRTKYQQETVDNIEKYGREAYIVLTGGERGYYVYKDNETPAFAREVKLEYYKNDKGQVSTVCYMLKTGEKSKTFNVDSKKDVSLVSRWYSANKLMDAYDLTYKKISDATDLTAVKKNCGDLPVFGYGLYEYNSTFYAEIESQYQKNFNKYIYKYFAIDSSKCTATMYYALKSDKTAVVKTDLTVTFSKNPETDMPIKMTIDGVEYDLKTYGVPHREIIIDVSGTEVETYEELAWFNYPEVAPEDYEEYFNGLIEEYEQSLQQTNANNSTNRQDT